MKHEHHVLERSAHVVAMLVLIPIIVTSVSFSTSGWAVPTALPSTEEAVSATLLPPESELSALATATPRPDASALVPCPESDDTDEACLPNDMVRLVGFVGTDMLTGFPILNRGTGKSPVFLNDSAGHPFTDLLSEPNRLFVVDGTITSMAPPTLAVSAAHHAAGAPGSETWLPELYTNSQVGFAIQYPLAWIVQDDTAMSGGIVSIQNYYSADLPFPGLVDPALYKVEIVPIMRSQATTLAEMRSGIEGQVVREQSITINRLSALRLTVDTESHGRTEILLVQLPDRVLLLQTWQGAALFDRMIETLRPTDAPAVPAGPVLTWKREFNGRCATVVMDAKGRAGFGPCSAPDRFSSIPPEVSRPDDLQHFLERYQPFESATPEGQVVFKGQGSQAASSAEQRAIANWAGLVEQELEYGRSGASWGMALAIVQDSPDPCVGMQMQRSGQFAAHDCHVGLESNGWRWMTAEQLAQLYTWLDTFRGFETHFTDGDQRVRFVFSGQGMQDATEAEQQAIFDWAKAVYSGSAGK